MTCVLEGRSWFGKNGGEHPHRCKGRVSRYLKVIPVCAGVLEEAGQLHGMQGLAKRYSLNWEAERELALAKHETLDM